MSASSNFIITLFISLLLCSTISCGLYGKNSNVISLSPKNFKEVLTTPYVWLVEFYAPWCGHCKNLAPHWERAATNLKGIVRVGAVNCDEESNRQLCGAFEIKGFPTLKWFGSEQSPNPHQKGVPYKKPVDYNGARSAAAIANFAINKLPNYVVPVTQKKHGAFMEKNAELPKVLLFSNKKKITSLYKALAIEFKNRMDFAQVQDSEKDLVQEYSVDSFPTLLVKKGEEVSKYEGKLKSAALIKFLSEFAPPLKDSYQEEKPKAAPAPPKPELVEVTSQEVWEEKCLSKRLCAIALLNPNEDEESHNSMLKTLTALSEKHVKQFKFLWLDGSKYPQVAKELDVSTDYPQFVVLAPKKKAVGQYIGTLSQDKMSAWLEKVLRGKKIYPVDSIPSL